MTTLIPQTFSRTGSRGYMPHDLACSSFSAHRRTSVQTVELATLMQISCHATSRNGEVGKTHEGVLGTYRAVYAPMLRIWSISRDENRLHAWQQHGNAT